MLLAKSLGFSFNAQEEKNVKYEGLTFVEKLKIWNKKSIFPPIEWFFDFSESSPAGMLYVETGSRMLNTNKNYICYVENGPGVFGYNVGKNNFINRFLLTKLAKRKNFKGFVFYSNASEKAFDYLFNNNDVLMNKKRGVIYPLIDVKQRASFKVKKRIGFCSSNFYLKGGMEVMEVARKNSNIQFDCITNISGIRECDLRAMPQNVNLIEFNLTSEEFNTLASNNWDMCIHPTYFDTVALSSLEMIKLGIPVIATNTFAISEYIENLKTGVIVENPYNPFDEDLMPIKYKYLGHITKELCIPQEIVNEKLVKEIISGIDNIYNNYSVIEKEITNFNLTSKFSSTYIKEQWLSLI